MKVDDTDPGATRRIVGIHQAHILACTPALRTVIVSEVRVGVPTGRAPPLLLTMRNGSPGTHSLSTLVG